MKKLAEKRREQITKSIKLEAIPVEATARAIKEQKLMQRNDAAIKNVETIKPAIDAFVRAMLDKALEECKYDFGKLSKAWENAFGKDAEKGSRNAYKKEVQDATALFSKKISSVSFWGVSGSAGLKKKDFIESILPEYAKDHFSGIQLADIYASCQGLKSLTAYANKFITSRCTALETWAPDRVLQNFEIYMRNVDTVKKFLASPYAEEFLKNFEEFENFQYGDFYEMCTTQAGINRYNEIISGTYDADGKLLKKGYNQLVNEINNKNRADQNYSGPVFRMMAPLYKQILMPGKKAFTIDKITSEEELKTLLRETFDSFPKEILSAYVDNVKAANPEGVFVSGKNLHVISHMAYGNHDAIPKAFREKLVAELEASKEGIKKKSEIKKIDEAIGRVPLTIADTAYSIAEIEETMGNDPIMSTYIACLSSLSIDVISNMKDAIHGGCLKEDVRIYRDHRQVMLVKTYLDSLIQFRKTLTLLKKNKVIEGEDALFYNEYQNMMDSLSAAVKANNLVRNYITSSPKDQAKEYLAAFGQTSKILNKWYVPSDKFKQDSFSIMEMDGKYYFIELSPVSGKTFIPEIVDENQPHVNLMAMQKAQKAMQIFGAALIKNTGANEFFENNPDENVFVLTDPQKTRRPFEITRQVYEIYTKKLFTKTVTESEEERKHYTTIYIDTLIRMCNTFTRFENFTFHFKEASAYKNIAEFFSEADTYMATSCFLPVSRKQMEDEIESGRLLAFLITNRTMYKDDCTKTSYAMLFFAIMEQTKQQKMDLRFNSRPSLTFRPACIPYHCTHRKGSILVSKRYKDGTTIRGDVYMEIYNYLNGRLEKSSLSKIALSALENEAVSYRVADYDIIKFKRYMEDKYFLNISYTKNCAVPKSEWNTVTEETDACMESGYRTLVITRGIKDLLYYTVYDTDRTTLESGSLNTVDKIDFGEKLSVLSEERNNAKRDSWDYDRTVKDIKESYLNFAISKIMKLVTKYDAIVVIESISDLFKDKMAALDNQVFAVFEKKLESRLCDYYDTKVALGKYGSLTFPMQLASSTRKGYKRNGILFRVSPAYTSNMCPVTGFVNLFDLSNITNNKTRRAFLQKFDSICFSEENNCFVAEMDYNNFLLRKREFAGKLQKSAWTLYLGKPYTKFNKQIMDYEYIEDPCKELVTLLQEKHLADAPLVIEDLSEDMVHKLYNIFENALRYNIVKACNENPFDYFSSPATMEDSVDAPADNRNYNLALKAWYELERKEENGDNTLGWINYAQNR